jgi:hypothetical protein
VRPTWVRNVFRYGRRKRCGPTRIQFRIVLAALSSITEFR